MTTTVSGEVQRVTFENEQTGFRVIKLIGVKCDGLKQGGEPLAVVGNFQAVGPGTQVRVTGQWVNDAKHGAQLRVETLVPIAPDTLVGLEKYLGSGIIPGIGPGLAKRVVGAFGMSALDVLDHRPEQLTRVPGLGSKRIDDIKTAWKEKRALSSVMVLLQSHGASPALAKRIWDAYGDRAASIVQGAPYRLALDVRGIGFKTADRIAHSLGIAGDHPERAQAGVWHALGQLADAGHTVVEREALVELAAAELEIEGGHVEAAIDVLWAGERVVVREGRVALARLDSAEHRLADGVQRLLGAPAKALAGVDAAIGRFEAEAGVTLAGLQREAVVAVAAHKLVVVTGGPGVGKTTLIKAMLSVFGRARLAVRLAAPTGRAAKRLSEATRQDASTLHRLLEFEPRSGRFQRDIERPLEVDALIVDEASMIDVSLGAALLEALPTAARLVIVGDADQLPSVGPGALLRDFISSGAVHCVRLDTIFRQSERSQIVQNAHRILMGQPPELVPAEGEKGDFFMIARREPVAAAELIEHLVAERIPKRFGVDPIDDVQVLSPMHRGAVGTTALNEALQRRLNPGGPELTSRGQVLRVGDKVMQTRNDYEREVFNGDLGRVVHVDRDQRQLVVSIDAREVVYEDSHLESLTLAYATSIHKSQGSEYPVVVVPLLTAHFVMLSRNLLYTAVTRARQLCVLVADPRAVHLALAETRKEQRQTQLGEFLAQPG